MAVFLVVWQHIQENFLPYQVCIFVFSFLYTFFFRQRQKEKLKQKRKKKAESEESEESTSEEGEEPDADTKNTDGGKVVDIEQSAVVTSSGGSPEGTKVPLRNAVDLSDNTVSSSSDSCLRPS